MKMPVPRRRGLLIDAALSSSVYLLPIVSPHVLFFAWMLLARPLARAGAEAPGWTAANWVVLLSAQIVLFTVLRLSRPLGRLARGGLVVATLAVLTIAVNWLLMVVVPLRYLTEEKVRTSNVERRKKAKEERSKAQGRRLEGSCW